MHILATYFGLLVELHFDKSDRGSLPGHCLFTADFVYRDHNSVHIAVARAAANLKSAKRETFRRYA